MNTNIFFIAGHNIHSPGSIGYDGVFEHTRNIEVRNNATLGLKTAYSIEGTSFHIKTEEEEKRNYEVRNWIEKNKKDRSRGVDIHFNNNNKLASGTEVVISPRTTIENKRRATWIANKSSEILGIPLRRRAGDRDYIYPKETYVGKLPILEQTTIPFLIYEVCFQNRYDLERYNKNKYEIGMMLRMAMVRIDFRKKGSENTPLIFNDYFYKSKEKTV